MNTLTGRKYLPLLFVSMSVVSCQDCNRNGCDALEQVAQTLEIDQGLAGAGVFLPDTVVEYLGEECSECPFGYARIRVWRASSQVSSVEGAIALCSVGPLAILDADPWYEIPLDAGYYLACGEDLTITGTSVCTSLSVAEGKITTLHAASTGGTPTLYVSEPGSKPMQVKEPLIAVCSLD